MISIFDVGQSSYEDVTLWNSKSIYAYDGRRAIVMAVQVQEYIQE